MSSIAGDATHVATETLRATLQRRIDKLTKINNALMQRVERSMDQQANAYSLFQTAIGLENQVRSRTDELKSALDRLEKANDELTAARDAAELANRFKTRFFTAVGHDLLQPLHAARLSLSAMDDADRPGANMRLAAQVDHALSSIEELLRTILDLSQLEAGAITPAIQPVAIDDLFQTLLLDLAPIAMSKSLSLTWRSSPLSVMSDPLMLRRILQNLLSNAVRYTETGGVKLTARRRKGRIVIDVWDTGPGIAAAEQARIFEEFQRGTAGERAAGAGFGLGLSIVLRTADALGHEIKLCSKVGRGTRISVLVNESELPAKTGAASKAIPPRQLYDFSAANVIVIDNDQSVLDAMRSVLTRWSCDARFAMSIGAVEDIVRQDADFRPDIVLADFHLDDGTSGLTAVARLRAKFGEGLPAIIITADHTTAVTDTAQEQRCEVLRKPVRPAELRALMQHLLG